MVVYLKGLNGIRAMAAMAVLVDHINGSFKTFGLTNLPKTELAAFGVTIFFSLSGFLITYLLVKEKEQKVISTTNFYIRRILRIWPIYFLIIVLVIGFIPNTINNNLLYYIFFIPNVPFVFGGTIELIGHYWSLGVEEQFYLFWPWCIKYFKNVLLFLILFVIFSILLKVVFKYWFGGWSEPYAFIYILRYDCMAIGGLGAWIAINRKELIEHKWFSYLVMVSWLTLGFVSFNRFHLFSIVDHEIIALVTVIIILNQGFSNNVFINLENRFLSLLGKISYGIYMYNPIVIFLLAIILKDINANTVVKYILIYSSAFLVTVFISYISYSLIEKPLLTMKSKFSFIKSIN